ncbi:nitroreductase [bacterium]|nr:nitroreductase [bacterium]
MNLIEGIKKRKSIRGFKPDPVSKEVIVSIIEAACKAPSAMNTQPWEFIVVTGEKLTRLKKEIVENLCNGSVMNPDHQVVGWGNDSVFRERQVGLAKRIFTLMKIPREDTEKRMQWMERGFRFFDAPVGVFLLTDKSLIESGPLLDLGAAMQNLCLAAVEYDLGTCIEDQSVLYPEVVRKILGIPEDKKIVIAIALGYPDWDFPANRLVSEREPVSNNTTWIGFDQG